MEKFIIIKDLVKNVRLFNLHGRTIDFKIKDIPKNEEPISWIKGALSNILEYSTINLKPRDKVGLRFCSKDFSKGEGWISFKDAKEININDVWAIIQGIYQSNSTGFNTDTFCLGVTSVRMPEGRGHRKSGDKNFLEEIGRRKGIIQINNKDNMCLPRALIVAISHVNKDPDYIKVRRDLGKIQRDRALALIQEARVEIPKEGAGINELQKFQQYFADDYKIIVYQYGFKGRQVIFEGASQGKNLNILHHERHFCVINSLTAAFCCVYYCESCHIPYNSKHMHRCGKKCMLCLQTPSCEMKKKTKCQDCLRTTFRSQECFENHKKPGSYDKNTTVCEMIRQCPLCLKLIIGSRNHICGEWFCKLCNKLQPEGHLCFIPVDITKPKTRNVLFIFFDLETRQEKLLEDVSLLHEVTLCVFKQFCDSCIETTPWMCGRCGVTTQVLRVNPLDRFVEYVINQRTLFKSVIVISHNGGGFDNQFILNKLITETEHIPEVIMRGTKIIMMKILNIKFLDSLNYFPMALSKLPKAFGLPDKFKKGYFPHFFNKKENEDYIGCLPPIEYYAPDAMKTEERSVFLKWYDQHKNDVFNFRKDIEEYCISDVEILYETCKKFQKEMLNSTNVSPFTEATTIASTCNKVFRRNFLKPDTIGIIPKNGYRYRDTQSRIAIKWLIWEEYQRGIDIHHAAKGKESVLNGVKVDGYSEQTNQVFSFMGCFYHGHTCFIHQRDTPIYNNSNETLNHRYENTLAITERLKMLGYEVIEIWECQFRRKMIENPEIQEYTEKHPLFFNTPLNPRDAFYGGRTGNCKTYYNTINNEKIKYLDVCSLYPWVCKYGKFPIGHPKVFVGEECKQLSLQQTDGLIKCKILPPPELYHPVLPLKMHNKLLFVLCKTCAESMNSSECTHNDYERALEGTWVIDEVLKAIEKGYIILDILEIWEYQTELYDPKQKSGGLFVEMMNTFIKSKQEASGWPLDCVTLGQKQKYIEDFYDKEGVKLNFNNISKNPGLRAQAKLILNSFWGKFGQSECQPQTKIINSPEVLYSMLTNPCIEINNILPINEKTLLINFRYTEESFNPLSTVNVAIASYVTAQARLKLYSYLELLDTRVLYYDTDSIIFINKEGEPEPPTGEFIGDLTDELIEYGQGSFITEFVCGGPKNYAYKLFSPLDKVERVVCKVKGICLNYEASRLVNFNSIKDMVLNDTSVPVKITSKNIRRTKTHEVITKEETKIYKPNSTKRVFLSDYDSVPFGFKKSRLI